MIFVPSLFKRDTEKKNPVPSHLMKKGRGSFFRLAVSKFFDGIK